MARPRTVGILGDPHANLSALRAALALLDRAGVTEIYCVGDVVGYGPRPNETIQEIRARSIRCVAGNHDWALLGRMDPSYFNAYARAALQWTRCRISTDNLEYLAALPLRIDDPDFCIFHGALPEPEAFNYLQSFPAARAALADFSAPVGFCGHTHLPMNFVMTPGRRDLGWSLSTEWTLGEMDRAIINVGSVGQPRDENPLAPVGIYAVQTRQMRLPRTPYDIPAEQRLICDAGLPETLGERLRHGI